MMICSGLGCVVALIGLAAAVFTEWIRADPQLHRGHAWLTLVSMLIASALTHCLHQVSGLQTAEIARDQDSWRRLVLPVRHTLLFIPIRWWSVIFLTMGIATTALDLTDRFPTKEGNDETHWLDDRGRSLRGQPRAHGAFVQGPMERATRRR
jgi:hypothetical protein